MHIQLTALNFLKYNTLYLLLPGKDVSIQELVSKTDGYSGAEISALCKEAAIFALRESISADTIRMINFDAAFSVVKPRLDSKSITYYEKVSSKFL